MGCNCKDSRREIEDGKKVIADLRELFIHRMTVDYALTIIDQAPTADVSPVVHGRWLTWEEQFPGEMPRKKSGLGVFCSACHNYSDNMFDYCPNCGCRMDGEDGESDGTKS